MRVCQLRRDPALQLVLCTMEVPALILRLCVRWIAPGISGFSGLQKVQTWRMERKMFWLTFAVLGLGADLVLPLWWAMGATVPIFVVSWWIAYRSGWF
jgi:hypothetical protein